MVNIRLFSVAMAGLLTGCQQYQPKPLTAAAVRQSLTPPSEQDLSVKAASLAHPILRSVELDMSDGLSPDEAAVLAVLLNPSLKAVRMQRAIAHSQLLQAGLLPNPSVSWSLDKPSGGTTAGSVSGYGFGLDWNASALITRAAQRDAAAANSAAVDLDVAWQEWQVAEAAKSALYLFVNLNDQVQIAQGVEQRLADNLKLVREATNRGMKTELDLAAAETAANQAQADLLDLRKQAAEQRLELNRLLGLPPEALVSPQPSAASLSHFTPPTADSLYRDLKDRRLDLVALRHGYESQEENVRAATLKQFPSVSIGLNGARDTGNLQTVGIGISIDLPLFDRNQAAIAEERATRQMLFDEYADRIFQARSEIAKLLLDISWLNKQIESAQAAEPDLQKLVDTYRRAVEQRQADVLSYYSAWNDVAGKQLEILRLKQQLVEARIALELASGLYNVDAADAAVSSGSSPATRQEVQH